MFSFKQFTVLQSHCAMKVGTDGVLLGSWVPVDGVRRALDVGTGTGLLALMLAQRCGAVVDAVEIDGIAASEAALNVANSPWNGRIHVHPSSIQTFGVDVTNRYDLIVCNPPYFKNALRCPNGERSLARHNDNLSYADLLEQVEMRLAANGCFALILPSTDASCFVDLAKQRRLFLWRELNVHPLPDHPPKRTLLAFSFEERGFVTSSLVIETARHQYTDVYKRLTGDFYLNF